MFLSRGTCAVSHQYNMSGIDAEHYVPLTASTILFDVISIVCMVVMVTLVQSDATYCIVGLASYSSHFTCIAAVDHNSQVAAIKSRGAVHEQAMYHRPSSKALTGWCFCHQCSNACLTTSAQPWKSHVYAHVALWWYACPTGRCMVCSIGPTGTHKERCWISLGAL